MSVIIPAFNRAGTIGRAIASVLAQTFQGFEVIVVDDASTDDLKGALGRFADPRLRMVRNERNAGASASRNRGLSLARGAYVAFLDSDDEWLPAKLEKQLLKLNQAAETVGVVYTGWQWTAQSDGSVIQAIRPSERGNLLAALSRKDIIGSFSTPMIKLELLLNIGGLDPALPARQDWDLWLRLAAVCEFEVVPEVLVKYYVHSESISGSPVRKIEGTEMVIEKHRAHFTPATLTDHFVTLTILSLLADDKQRIGKYLTAGLRSNPWSVRVYWKTLVHFVLWMAGPGFRRKFFNGMKSVNKDFYWIAGE